MNQPASNALIRAAFSFSYPDQPLFEDFSAEIKAGVSLIRSEESRGKSTLVQLLAAEIFPQTGKITLNGLDSAADQTEYKKQVYFLDPRTNKFDHLTAIEYFSEVQKNYPEFDQSKIPTLIDGLGLTAHQNKALYMLSAGSKRKVWIAAGLASGAPLTLIDDVTAALDRESISFIINQLISLSQFDDRHIVITHYDMLERVPFSSVIDL